MTPILAQAATEVAQAATEAAQAATAAGGIGGSGAAEFWLFWILAPLSLAAALCVVLLKNPVHAALMLVLNFGTFAIFYAVLEAQFLGAIQVIVYAGAIMILFLFVLMLLGVDRAGEQGPGKLRGQTVAAVLLGVVLFATLTVVVAGPFLGTDSACSATPAVAEAQAAAGADARPCAGLQEANEAAPGGNVAAIGRILFSDYVWPFEVTSVLLVIAAIGAMVIGRRSDDLSDLVDVGRAAEPGVPHRPETTAAAVGAPDPAPALTPGRDEHEEGGL